MRKLQIQILSRVDKSGASIGDYAVDGYIGKGGCSVVTSSRRLKEDSPYSIMSAQFNHSITQSNVLSKITLISTKPYSIDIAFQGGQPVRVWDGSKIIFDGVIVRPIYYIRNQMQYCDLVLGLYTYQLTRTPLFFTSDQLAEIAKLLNIPNLSSSVAGNVSLPVGLGTLLDTIKSGTDYSVYGKNTWVADIGDVGNTVYIMAQTGQTKDTILRQSIDFLNEVFYQQESGEWVLKTLNTKNYAPFTIDVTNQLATTMKDKLAIPVGSGISGTIPSLTDLYFVDNSYDTPLYTTNYGMVPPDIVNAAGGAQSFIVSVTPNLSKFKRMSQLANSSWFIGDYSFTDINGDIVSDPAMAQTFNQGYIAQNPYLTSAGYGLDKNRNMVTVESKFTAYQMLLTYKDMARKLTNYYQMVGTFLLDDPALKAPDGAPMELGNILGTIVPIGKSAMESGIVATTCRSYNEDGIASLSISLVPLGSIAGKWES